MLKRLFLVVMLSAFTTPACAEAVSSAATDSNLMVGIIVAVITGLLSAIATGFVTDRYTRSTEQRQKKATQDEVVRNYLGPLSDACEKVVWRMSEVFVSQQAQWSNTDAPADFTEYKQQSTLYRIATLLAWMRAIDTELRSLQEASAILDTPLSGAMRAARDTLSNGRAVEKRRLDGLCGLWGMNISEVDDQRRARLATRLEIELYRLDANSRNDPTSLRAAPAPQQLSVCVGLNRLLASELGLVPRPAGLIELELKTAVAPLCYRETLIYHDWQDAIADAMLKPDADSIRRFKVVGYEKFIALLHGKSPWFMALRDIVHDLRLDAPEPNDCRLEQLKIFAQRTASILLAIADREPGLIKADSVKDANDLLRA
jgi:hypothetical protein